MSTEVNTQVSGNPVIDHLGLWSSVYVKKATTGRGSNGKISAYGIQKLRELILELAVRGKLVPQDPDDEPASVLLEKIANEKARLIKEGKLKRQKKLPEISPEEEPFDLPTGWAWSRFGSVFELEYGKNLPQAKRTNTGEYPVYGSNGVVGTHDLFSIAKLCIVVGRKGSAGALNLCQNEGCWVTDVAYSTVPPTDMDLVFTFKLFHTLGLDGLGKGIKPGLNRNEAYVLVVAIPPLAEQHRIVAKIDELMTLCDQLEQQQTDSLQVHQTLVETLLRTLVDASNAQSAQQAWNRIAEHFDTLFTTEASIDQLKQTILQLAVMGKLVPQDSNDEPASVLLEMIDEEKAQLVREGKIKKLKVLPVIGEDEISFGLPTGWVVSRLGVFTIVGTGATPARDKPEYYFPPEISWVTSGETGQEYIENTNEKISPLAVKETNVSLYPIGSLVVAMYGQGKTRGQISELMIEAGTNQACAAIILVNKDSSHRRYVKYFFKKAYEEIRSGAAGGAQPNLNVGKISNTAIPLPPLAEQSRIVAKVDKLMALCDALKARIQDAQTTQVHLADAVVERAVS